MTKQAQNRIGFAALLIVTLTFSLVAINASYDDGPSDGLTPGEESPNSQPLEDGTVGGLPATEAVLDYLPVPDAEEAMEDQKALVESWYGEITAPDYWDPETQTLHMGASYGDACGDGLELITNDFQGFSFDDGATWTKFKSSTGWSFDEVCGS